MTNAYLHTAYVGTLATCTFGLCLSHLYKYINCYVHVITYHLCSSTSDICTCMLISLIHPQILHVCMYMYMYRVLWVVSMYWWCSVAELVVR